MMKIFRFFGKLIGAVLVLVFIFSLFSSIFMVAITTQIFNPDFLLEIFEDQEIFDQLPGLAATQIRYSMTYNPCLEDPDMCENEEPPEEAGGGGPPSYFQVLSEEDWESLMTELLPEDWLETQVTDLINNLIESIRSGSEEIPVGISLLDLKEHLTGQGGVEAVTNLMKAQPECTEDDLLELVRILDGSDDSGKDFLSCSPGSEFLDNYAPQIEVLLNRSLKDIPDEIDIAQGLGENEISIDALEIEVPLTVLINFVRWLILVSPLLNLLLLLVIAFFAVHSFRALRGWWGYPVAIAGLLATGIASLITPAANLLSKRFLMDPPLAGIHEDMVELARGLALEILRLIFLQARNYGLIVTGIGLTIIVVASVLKTPGSKPQDQQEPQEEEPPSEGETEETSSEDEEEQETTSSDQIEKEDGEEEPIADDISEETAGEDGEEEGSSTPEGENEIEEDTDPEPSSDGDDQDPDPDAATDD